MADSDDILDPLSVQRAFDGSAARYEEAAVLQRFVANEMLERLVDLEAEPKQVLDIGCGTGFLTCGVCTRFPAARVIALDLAPAMARQTASHNCGHTLCADAHRLPFARDSMDVVVSSLAVQWCDFQRVFESVRDVLKPGGLWLFSSAGPDTLMELRNAWASVDDGDRVHDFVDMHHLGDALLALGFTDPVLDVDRVNIAYPDVATLLRDMKTLGVVNARRTRPRGMLGRKRFAALVQAYEKYRGDDGDLPSTWEVIYGHARLPGPTSVKVDFTAHSAAPSG